MSRPDFQKEWASSRLAIPTISDPDYALGLAAYLGSQPPTTDDHDYIFNLQDKRAVWLGEQMLLAVGHEWQSDVSYDAYAVVRSPVNGQLYRSLVGSNLGNEPSVSGAQWALGVADYADTINAPIATVAAAGTINLTTGAPDTSQIAISGTGVNINGFTVAANRFFIVKMTGASNTLVNSASLVTGRGADIPVVAGDSFLMRSTAANTVEIVCGIFLIDRTIGSGQTWQDVSASRAAATNYTNTTGKPITICVSFNYVGNGTSSITVDGVLVNRFTFGLGGTGATMSAIIPAGSVYSAQGNIGIWSELR